MKLNELSKLKLGKYTDNTCMLILRKDKKLGNCLHGQITFGNSAFCNILYFLVIFGLQPHLNIIFNYDKLSFEEGSTCRYTSYNI